MLRAKSTKREAPRDGSKLTVGIVVADYNEDITHALLQGAMEALHAWKVPRQRIRVLHTFGSFELPLAAQRLARRHRLAALIAIGCIVKGETSHDKHLAQAVLGGLMRVSLDEGLPVGLAVLTVDSLAQAKARSRGSANHGANAALAALRASLA